MKNLKKEQGLWPFIWSNTKEYHNQIIIAILMSLFNGGTVSALTIIYQRVIDDGLSQIKSSPTGALHVVIFWACVYLVVYALRIGTWAVCYKCSLKAMEGFLFNLRSRFFGHIQSLCMRFFDKNSSGELFNYMMGTPMSSIKDFLSQFILTVPIQMCMVIIYLITMFKFDWFLSVIMLISIAISAIISIASRPKIRKLSRELLQSESEASKYIDNIIHGSRAIKMYSIEDQISETFDSKVGVLKNKGVKLNYTRWIWSALGEYSQQLATAIIYVAGAYSCIYRGLTIGEFVAFVAVKNTISTAITAMYNVILMKSSAESGMNRIQKILSTSTTTPENKKYHSVELATNHARTNGLPCISFENVQFAYEDKPVLKNFTTQIHYNESVALVGSSGSGKSTITKLIMRLYDVNSGSIKLYGRDITDFNLHELRSSMGIVPQDPYIFKCSIIENIRMAAPDAPMLEVMQAMETARVHEFVNDLPQGWNTIVGDDGYGLSGGQRQRIAIARAILGKPEILIFDEATSALDNISEHYIQLAMEDLMKTHTVIIVAHRLSTIRNVDRILVFDRGNMVDEGTYEELSNRDGLFKNMLDAAQN